MNLVCMFSRTSALSSMILAGFLIHSNPASAQQRACVITDEGATVCGKPTKPTKKPNSSLGCQKEFDNYIVLLKGCKRLDTTIKCTVQITNKGVERPVLMDIHSSSIVDSSGAS
jgi:hypothetical protein